MLTYLHRALSRYLALPLFWRIKRVPVARYYSEFQAHQNSSQSDFQQRQNLRLHNIIRHALETVPEYRNLDSQRLRSILSNDPVECLKKLPIIQKVNLVDKLNSFKSNNAKRYFKNSSGGSTGSPVIVYQDIDYKASSLAARDCIYRWAGVNAGDTSIKLWGAERDFVKGAYGFKQKFADFIGNRTTLNAFNMTPNRMSEYVAQINVKRPMCLEGYADSLYSLACFVAERSLTVHRPSAIVSSAGTLLPHMRDQIEGTFSCPVFDRYGCREASSLAAECSVHEGLHIFGETTFVELLDRNGSEVEPGEEGRVVVTNLFNRAMPLLRYEIGDYAVKGRSSCTCGMPYPKLQRIIGRSSAIFRTKDGGYVLPELFIHLIGVTYNDGEIAKFQVVQKDQETIVVRLVFKSPHELDGWQKKDILSALIAKAMNSSVNVVFQQEDDIELTPTGKFLYTVSHI